VIAATHTFSAVTTVGGTLVMLGLLGALVVAEGRRQHRLPGYGQAGRSVVALLTVVFAADVVLRFVVLGHGL
jgi:hypothetical protein